MRGPRDILINVGHAARINGLLIIERMRLQRLIDEDAYPGAWYHRLRLREVPELIELPEAGSRPA